MKDFLSSLAIVLIGTYALTKLLVQIAIWTRRIEISSELNEKQERATQQLESMDLADFVTFIADSKITSSIQIVASEPSVIHSASGVLKEDACYVPERSGGAKLDGQAVFQFNSNKSMLQCPQIPNWVVIA
ncbi:hypothetical protein [Pollutimonas sp. M17]|uniref:hypothetical protein n=1 Tax=Pollutimonas sp. M17 TaxID=2962065 RepID=UPI0021F4EC82|nr:hypothetical protein [Pollutimonas sp. M17]UYO93951.1 hypothetical protein OEG81_01065 [Pollutimonas sp. M17]